MPRRAVAGEPRPRLSAQQEPGIFARILLQRMRQDPSLVWPPSVLIRSCEISEQVGWPAVDRLLVLGLVVKWSRDTVVRIRLSPRGRSIPL